MKLIAWYAIIVIVFKLGFAIFSLVLGETLLFALAIITVVFEVPVLLMCVWFIRGKVKKALAWYTDIIYSLQIAIMFIALSQQGITWREIAYCISHAPMLYLATRIIRIK